MSVLADIEPVLAALLDAAPGHLLVATVLAGCLIGTTFFIRDARVRRAASLAALLVFIVPLPDLLPDRGVATLQVPQFTFDETAADVSATAAGPSAFVDPVLIIVLVWIAVASLLLVRTLLNLRGRNHELRELSNDVAERLGIPPDVPVRVSAGPEGPRVTGMLRPAIIVPAPLLDPEREDELRAVLLHELAHVRQKDNLWSAVSALVTSLFWFHPLAWIAALRFRAFSEVACDAAVIEAGVPLTTYLESLRKVIADAPYEQTAQVALGGGSLKERIRIMKSPTSPMSRLAARTVVVALAVVTLGTGLSLRALTGDEPSMLLLPAGGEEVSAYRIESEIVPVADGRLHVQFAVIDPAGGVYGVGAHFERGKPVTVGYNSGDEGERLSLFIEMTPTEVPLEYEAKVRIYRGGESTERTVRTSVNEQKAKPIDLKLKDAKLSDVLDLFASLLKVDLIVSTDIEDEVVTADSNDVPWDQVLDSILHPRGLDWAKVGNLLLVNANNAAGQEATGAEDLPSSSDPRIQPPTVLDRVQPEYTEEAQSKRVQGMVILELAIGEDGTVRNVKVLKPLPMGLAEAAVEAVRQWKFSPGTIEGKPVPVMFNVTIDFRLPPPA